MHKETFGLIEIFMGIIGPYVLEPYKGYWWIWIVLFACFFSLCIAFILWPSKTDLALQYMGLGGRGGNAKVFGQNSMAEGGKGGHGGIGTGGAGGDAEVIGDNSYARGGDGGNSGTPDGRGGRRTISPGEHLNLPTVMWSYGYGGAGANDPEYNRRLKLLIEIRSNYMKAFPCDADFIKAGIDQIPLNWVNKSLEELQESWQIEIENGLYKMPSLNHLRRD